MSRQHRPTALVIGGHFQGLGAIRALSQAGVSVALVDSEPNISRFSRDVSRYIMGPKVDDAPVFLTFLRRLAEQEGLAGAVIFPTDDETVHFLSTHHEALSPWFTSWMPPWAIIEPLYHKGVGYQLAERIGVPIPKTDYPENREEAASWEGPFPALIKPAVMRRFFKQTGHKVFRAMNTDELVRAYDRAAAILPADEILIQEQIPDVSRHLYSFCPVFDGEKTLARIVARRIRQHPMDFGQASTFAETVRRPELERLGETYLKAVGYSGLAEVEFVMDPRDGVYKFLEVNPRIWGWHTLALAAGVNLPYLCYRWAIGDPVQSQDYGDARWMRILTDVGVAVTECLKGRMRPTEYLESLKGSKTYAVWSGRDPLPFFAELMLLPYMMVKRGF